MMKNVCVQGLGFVGMASAVASAAATDRNGNPLYNVIGVEIETPRGREILRKIEEDILPIDCNDQHLKEEFLKAKKRKNLRATTDVTVYQKADVVLVAVHLDLTLNVQTDLPEVPFNHFKLAIQTLGQNIKPGCLIIIETTVPPGTCEKIVWPILQEEAKKRNLPTDAFLLAHSYERVMPGKDYLNSIRNFWRVYSGINEASANGCEQFLKTLINTEKFPLTKLENTTSSEMGKVLENSYRAVNIAFIEEWGRFAEKVGVDIYSVVDAIRVRPTHNNIRQPGLGVGGYCLTKDPLFAYYSARELFHLKETEFPFCLEAIKTNKKMPLVTVEKINEIFGGKLAGKKILILGASYLPDVGDMRFSPTLILVQEFLKQEAIVTVHDPLVEEKVEGLSIEKRIPQDTAFDLVLLAVSHREYELLDFSLFANNKNCIIFDSNRVLTKKQIEKIQSLGLIVKSIGRGNL